MIKKDNFIFKTFLKLTSKTYPYGYEDVLAQDMIKSELFPKDIQKDKHGNYFYKIGNSRTVFTSHLDTACKDHTSVKHVIDKNIIKTDGKTILGADDKAGVTILLWMMIHNIPGLYYFFVGEEVGCVGSGLASKHDNFKGDYDRMISFDRRGLDSVITHQSFSRSCSDEFAVQLAGQLNLSKGLSYKKDDTGVYTDSAEFVDVIPECTNISVGYYSEHTVTERQDIDHLRKLADACLLVNWEKLVTKRDMTKKDYKSYSYDNTWSIYNNKSAAYTSKKAKKSYGYHDDWYDQTDAFNRDKDRKRGRLYLDNGDGLTEIEDEQTQLDHWINNQNPKINSNKRGDSYEWIMEKFIGKLTFDDLEVIKEQYLDMNKLSDKVFYSYLLSEIDTFPILEKEITKAINERLASRYVNNI